MQSAKDDEVYVPLKSYPNYFISNYGNVVSNKIGYHVSVISHLNKLGYPIVKLTNKKGEEKCIPVHVLVANNFVQKHQNEDSIIFKDKNILNHKAGNLKWAQ